MSTVEGTFRYGNTAIAMREDLSADGLVLLVIGGDKGSGFAASFSEKVDRPETFEAVAVALEGIAEKLREHAKGLR